MRTYDKIPSPPRTVLPPRKDFSISCEHVIQLTKQARKEIFEEERKKTYYAISAAANKGQYYIEYSYPENCNREDIKNLQAELIKKGFKTGLKAGISDGLNISWLPKEEGVQDGKRL